jgi:hypothetical protein
MANDIALLSNHSLALLAQLLVNNYPTRADQISMSIAVAFFEQTSLEVQE